MGPDAIPNLENPNMKSLSLPTLRVLGAATLALVLSGAGSSAAAQQLPPARQILDRYVQAIGGKSAAAQHQSRRMVAEMSMPAAGMTMTMESFAARPNKMLVKMQIPGMGEMLQGYDGQVAWSMNPVQGARVLAGAELAQTVRQADFDAVIDPSKGFTSFETTERTEMAGRPCYMVRLTPAEGGPVHSCFDTETGLMVGSRTKQQTPMGEVEAIVTLSDYRDFGGLKLPARTTTSVAGQEMVLTIKEITYGNIEPSVFALPAEIRALAPAKP